MFDEKFFRMWEFYLAGCEMAFKWGDQVVYQFQLTKNYTSTPVTRDYICLLYTSPSPRDRQKSRMPSSA